MMKERYESEQAAALAQEDDEFTEADYNTLLTDISKLSGLIENDDGTQVESVHQIMDKLMKGEGSKEKKIITKWECPICHLSLNVKNKAKHCQRHRRCMHCNCYHFNKDLLKCPMYLRIVDRIFPMYSDKK